MYVRSHEIMADFDDATLYGGYSNCFQSLSSGLAISGEEFATSVTFILSLFGLVREDPTLSFFIWSTCVRQKVEGW